jgi:hypothetical protein
MVNPREILGAQLRKMKTLFDLVHMQYARRDRPHTTIGRPGVEFYEVRRSNRQKLEVGINWGGNGAKKRVKLVRSAASDDLVFQPPWTSTHITVPAHQLIGTRMEPDEFFSEVFSGHASVEVRKHPSPAGS